MADPSVSLEQRLKELMVSMPKRGAEEFANDAIGLLFQYNEAHTKQQRELRQFEELLRYAFLEIDRLGFFSLAELLRRKMETWTLNPPCGKCRSLGVIGPCDEHGPQSVKHG